MVKHNATKTYWERGGGTPPSTLTSTLGVATDFTLRPHYPAACTAWMEDCVSPWAGLDGEAERKIPAPDWNLTPVVQPVASHFTGSVIPAFDINVM
jgi:hypothetical protein